MPRDNNRTMRRLLTLLAWAAALPTGAVETVPAVDAAAMTAAHNRWRREVGVADLQWSRTLAHSAQEWADRLAGGGCALTHGTDMHYGENIYWAGPVLWSTGRTERRSLNGTQVVDAWAAERALYDHDSHRCAGVCGHYTQIVWHSSARVGCGMSVCADQGQVWVCRYTPPGNVSGLRPY